MKNIDLINILISFIFLFFFGIIASDRTAQYFKNFKQKVSKTWNRHIFQVIFNYKKL